MCPGANPSQIDRGENMKAVGKLSALLSGLLLATAADAASDSTRVTPASPHQVSISARRVPEMSKRVVSYLVSNGDSPDLWGPDAPLDPTPYDWRIYNPETRQDGSFL